MKLGLINSAWAQAGKETAYGIWMTREIGFDAIDIFVDPLDASDMELRLIRNECERAGLPIVSVACVALGLVDFNPSVQRFHVGRVKAYLDAARTFGARNVLLVLGEYVWQREVIPPAEQWETGVRNVRAVGEYAGELGLRIALEMEPFHLSLLNDVPKMARFLDDVGLDAVRANVDISHMVLARQGPETLASLSGRIAHVHISDCDGKVHGDLPPGRGVVEFGPYLKALGDLGVESDTISVELEYSPEPDRIVDWVREAHAATAALMREAGLRP
jgi:sugar phosphate isomerase/epimerase